jgi:RimJ/RimL family protein N-acetyltransferase
MNIIQKAAMPCLFENPPYFENDTWIIRLPGPEDAADLRDLFKEPLSQEQAEGMIRHFMQAWMARKEVILACFEKASEHVQVVIELYSIQGKSAEIGYRTRYGQRGKGYASGAVSFASYQLLKEGWLDSLHASVNCMNSASIRILEKAGFQKVKEGEKIKQYQLVLYLNLTKRV